MSLIAGGASMWAAAATDRHGGTAGRPERRYCAHGGFLAGRGARLGGRRCAGENYDGSEAFARTR
jgi:hypothetical protein